MDLNYCAADALTVAESLATGVLWHLTSTPFLSHPLCPLLDGEYRTDGRSMRSVRLPLGNGCDRLVEGTVFFEYDDGGQ